LLIVHNITPFWDQLLPRRRSTEPRNQTRRVRRAPAGSSGRLGQAETTGVKISPHGIPSSDGIPTSQPYTVLMSPLSAFSRVFQSVLPASGLVLLLALPSAAHAWGNGGHRLVNKLGASSLPADVPAFLRSPEAIGEIEYLGPEPDRWRSPAEPELNAAQAPEHFIDLEPADALGPLPRRRLDFEASVFASGQRPEKVGLQPWEATEIWERLKAALREYRHLAADHQDTRPVEQAILFYSGWLGHYVGDGSQPLHTTIQYNGWTGPNPHGYTTEHRIHAQFETAFVHANVKPADVAPLVAASKPEVLHDVFADYLAYLRHSNTLVEQTYQLEKTGAFAGAGTPEGKAFVDRQLAAGAIELRNMIYTAWIKSAEPVPAYTGN